MIQLPLDEIQPGMRVARSILGTGAGAQLAAGYVLDEAVIARCKKMGMHSLWVSLQDEEEPPAGNINDQLALQAQHAWKDNMELLKKIGETQDITLESLEKFKSDPGRFKDIVATEQIKGIVDQIIKSIMSQESMMVNLASMRTEDGYLHQHALDVTITATMIASRLKYPVQDIQEMALGSFLMDLGMIIIPEGALSRATPPGPRVLQLLREHPAVGFTILRANSGVPINAAHVAFQHHERMDGRGYPRGLKAQDEFPYKTLNNESGNIHRYAQVVAVADQYISAVAPRPGSQDPLPPLDAMRRLIADAGGRLNSHVVNSLISLIPVFPLGTKVLIAKSPRSLLVGYLGVVTRANPKDKEKPQVVLLFDKFKRKIKPVLIDLAEENGFALQFAAL